MCTGNQETIFFHPLCFVVIIIFVIIVIILVFAAVFYDDYDDNDDNDGGDDDGFLNLICQKVAGLDITSHIMSPLMNFPYCYDYF